MTIDGPARLSRISAVLLMSAVLLVTILIPAPAAEALAFSGSPCPQYSIQDVFDDPSGNWDGDQVNNSDELYNGLNPCTVDTTNFCSGGGNPLCIYRNYTYSYYPSACQTSINAFPNGDYDGDGIANAVEVRNGANPCTHPCPNPTYADLALNPNGSWDNDGISNALEVNQGTNPCSSAAANPCPYYTYSQVNYAPTHDWDRDGFSNADEVRLGTNPCVYNASVIVPKVTVYQQPTQRLPHVAALPRPVTVAPIAVRPICPYGYPYFHAGNGLCYANPTTSHFVR